MKRERHAVDATSFAGPPARAITSVIVHANNEQETP
jgi:hypothetical protein